MIRTIVGVVIGYVVMFVVIFITLTALYLMLGANKTFESGTFKLSTFWLAMQALFFLAAGIIAGKVCRVISGRGWSLILFVLLVLVLGLLLSIPALLLADTVPARVGDIGVFQAMSSGRAPKWFSVLMPFVSAFGVVIGGTKRNN